MATTARYYLHVERPVTTRSVPLHALTHPLLCYNTTEIVVLPSLSDITYLHRCLQFTDNAGGRDSGTKFTLAAKVKSLSMHI